MHERTCLAIDSFLTPASRLMPGQVAAYGASSAMLPPTTP